MSHTIFFINLIYGLYEKNLAFLFIEKLYKHVHSFLYFCNYMQFVT